LNTTGAVGVGTTTNAYGGSLTNGITLGYNTSAGTNLADTLVFYAATSTANISTSTNALYNVNGTLYFNGSVLGAGGGSSISTSSANTWAALQTFTNGITANTISATTSASLASTTLLGQTVAGNIIATSTLAVTGTSTLATTTTPLLTL
jgi:hypothetical protein